LTRVIARPTFPCEELAHYLPTERTMCTEGKHRLTFLVDVKALIIFSFRCAAPKHRYYAVVRMNSSVEEILS